MTTTPPETEWSKVDHRLVERTMRDLVAHTERRAEAMRAIGRWDDLRQLRLDGLRDIASVLEDCSLGFLFHLAYANGFNPSFALVDPEDAE